MTLRFTPKSTENSIKLSTKTTLQNWDPKKNNNKPIFNFNAEANSQVSLGNVQEKLLMALTGGHICEGCEDPDDLYTLSEKDLKEAHQRFKSGDINLFGNIKVKEFRYDEKAGVANITTQKGDVLRVDLLTEYEKTSGKDSSITNAVSAVTSTKTTSAKPVAKIAKVPDKYEGIPKSWIPYIQNLSKSTGYSEELIMNIISYESFTPKAKYKKEDGGLYEVGFGHTTKANHNNKFGKGFKIDIATAFKWLGQDIKDKEAIIKKFGAYYNYDKLPKPMQEALIDVAFNRGEGRLDPNSKAFDPNYKSVHANIEKGYIGSAAVRLRQEKFYIHEPGLRKRNVQRFLKTMKNLPAKQIIASMDLFNRENYYTKTLSMLKQSEADFLRRDWNNIYYSAKSSA